MAKFKKSIHLLFAYLLVWHISCANAQVSPKACVTPAASYHGVNPALLLAVLTVESGLRHQVVRQNANGTYDIGIGQINSIHLPELQRYGLDASQLLDACKGTYVSAWLLRRGFDRYGKTWFAAASYHSITPVHNLRYQNLLQATLLKNGIDPNSVIAAQ